ncbi:quinoprotein glucose dehydrogenase [Bacillus sp. FJAT-27225]|uniref:PQQ-dependent sugar dehydrogenase n=1 Tax=Bacillus sp. FJAT-27225 TaxID=1743144 RepID=UPI00080C20FF|nr:sorbosone dehydrogenase family protein [Bacillus sp. FJAT-27225]OCA82321.1 quinoprotein glucose dehydrogenase [Bacillus sp. FJAT-27225]
MRKWISILAVTAAVLTGCTSNSDGVTPNGKVQNGDEAVSVQGYEVLAENLEVPWSIAKSGETFFITERPGTIAKIENSQLERQKVELKKTLSDASEAGLLGFVLHPDFPKQTSAFAYYTYHDAVGQKNRVIVLSYDGTGWREEETLLDGLPSGPVHHGGRLEIGPDGKLYVTAGDAAKPETAQDPTTLGGKILRMNLDGSIPADNPFSNSYVYSYGHRNPQGIAWLSDGTMYASEHGQSAHDEINRIEAGKNYGWPTITGDEKQGGMETPLFHSGNETWAPSGMSTDGEKLYVATLRGNAVREFDVKADTTRVLINKLGRIRDVLVDGEYLYFVSNNTDGRGDPMEKDDKLYRILLTELQ